MLLWITKTLSTFPLPRCWPKDKHGGLSTSLNLILLLGSILVILAPNWMLSLDGGWDIYPKGRNTGYTTVNSYNFKPIFTQQQLMVSIWVTVLLFSFLCAATIIDLDILHQDILSALSSNLIATKHISIDGQWSKDPNSFLLDNRIYVPSAGDLHTYFL